MLTLISYRRTVRIFKWLTLVLFSYVITAFLAKPAWAEVLRATFLPEIHWSREYLAVLVGNPRHHHLPVPVLLAGGAGSERKSAAPDASPLRSAKARPAQNCDRPQRCPHAGCSFPTW